MDLTLDGQRGIRSQCWSTSFGNNNNTNNNSNNTNHHNQYTTAAVNHNPHHQQLSSPSTSSTSPQTSASSVGTPAGLGSLSPTSHYSVHQQIQEANRLYQQSMAAAAVGTNSSHFHQTPNAGVLSPFNSPLANFSSRGGSKRNSRNCRSRNSKSSRHWL